MSNEKDQKAEVHFYDGIEEHDNMLPRWWLGILYGSILFGAGYFAHYVLGPGPTLVQEYEDEARVEEFRLLAENAGKKALSETELVALVKAPEKQKAGSTVFQSKCASCHGPQGGGGIGPNLTDEYWIHGGKLAQIVKTVTDGVGDKGMPPWGSVLSQDELYSVVAYVRSIRGSNPPGSKAPQGDKYTE